MSIAASVANGFSRSRRLSEALDAFFGKSRSKNEPQPRSQIEKDLVELSPVNQLRQTITQFQRETRIEASLTMSIKATTEKPISEEMDPKLDRDLDLMLRLISRDEKEYATLRGRYEKLLKIAREDLGKAPRADVKAPAQTQAASNSLQVDMRFQKHRVEEERVGISLEELGVEMADPLVLDLSGEGINLTRAGEGAVFDINADGKQNNTAWVQGGTAMLVYDRNGNGKIDNGAELFGDQNGSAHGFGELAKYDSNSDGRINRLDPIFKALRLYQDMNGNGKIDEGELFTLPELGIKALKLDFFQVDEKINGNSLILRGSFEREDGSVGEMSDVLLGYKKL